MSVPVLATSRLLLRPFVPTDWDAHQAMLADHVAMEHMHFVTWDEAQRRAWFTHCLANASQPQPDDLNWTIERNLDHQVIGWIGIGTAPDPEHAFDIDFGYALARAFWGQGFMPEALRGVFAYEFDTLKVPQLQANCRAPNTASARVMEKAGMRRTHSDEGADFEGNRSHRHHYRITRAEWNALAHP
ncbi:MAG: GNAT family N-acetyltransferase [Thermomicrobiales bacterium]